MITKDNLVELLKALIKHEENENKLYKFKNEKLFKLKNTPFNKINYKIYKAVLNVLESSNSKQK